MSHSVEWSGMFSVLLTPFDARGGLDETRYRDLVRQNIADGARGLVVAGSTGEFNALSDDERVRLYKIAAEEASGQVVLLAGVSALLPGDTRELGLAARNLAYDGLLVLPPLYAMPNEREVIEYYAWLGREVELPIMAYNGPRRTGVNLIPTTVARLAELDWVVAIKDSSGSIVQLGDLIHLVADRLRVFTGHETMLLPAVAMGAHGCISMSTQIVGRRATEFHDSIVRNDLTTARRLEAQIYLLYKTFEVGNYYSAMKADMELVGRGVGPPRRPLLPVTEDERARIKALLVEAELIPTPV